ncbi:hypothetical protein, partial [Bacillus amyloliquefaciens]|uniref:hypothetical protein n=1 Tax=Bacillus amyloliquefaciens TaxID=1390 RepID=UPI0023ED7BA8
MTPATMKTSHVVINRPAIVSSKLELKTASTSMSIGLKMSSSLQNQSAHLAVGPTKKVPAAFERRLAKWIDEEYRQGYLEASLEQGIAWQIRAN